MINIKSILVLSVAAITFAACSKSEETRLAEQSIKVETELVNERDVVEPVHSVGKVYAKEEVKLAFKTGGIIKEILVDEGQHVRKGQVLAILNLSEIEARVNQSQLSHEKAQRDYQRAYELYQDSVVTLEQLQNAQTQLEIVRSEMEIAQFNLKYSQIVAPSEGKVLKRLSGENEMISPGYPVFMFGSMANDWVVRANISESQIFRIQENDKAIIKLDAYPDKSISGVVSEIGNLADPYTGTYEIEISMHTPGLRMASGLFARFDISPQITNSYDVIPVDALVEANEKEGFVYKVTSSQSVVREKVSIKNVKNNQLYVHSGLVQGDAVVTKGASYINSNSQIEIVNASSQIADASLK